MIILFSIQIAIDGDTELFDTAIKVIVSFLIYITLSDTIDIIILT